MSTLALLNNQQNSNTNYSNSTLIQGLVRIRTYFYNFPEHETDEEVDERVSRCNEVDRLIVLAKPACLADVITLLEIFNEEYSQYHNYKKGEPLNMEGDCHATELQMVRTVISYLRTLEGNKYQNAWYSDCIIYLGWV